MSNLDAFELAIKATGLLLMAVVVFLLTALVVVMAVKEYGYWTPAAIGATFTIFFLSFRKMKWDDEEGEE